MLTEQSRYMRRAQKSKEQKEQEMGMDSSPRSIPRAVNDRKVQKSQQEPDAIFWKGRMTCSHTKKDCTQHGFTLLQRKGKEGKSIFVVEQ